MANPIINHVTAKGSSGPAPAPSAPGVSGGSLNGGGGGHLKGSINGTAAVPAVSQAQDTEQTASSTFLMSVLRNDPQVTKLYAPVFELMQSVLAPASVHKPAHSEPISDPNHG